MQTGLFVTAQNNENIWSSNQKSSLDKEESVWEGKHLEKEVNAVNSHIFEKYFLESEELVMRGK